MLIERDPLSRHTGETSTGDHKRLPLTGFIKLASAPESPNRAAVAWLVSTQNDVLPIGRPVRSSRSAGVGSDDDVTLSFDADPVRREVRRQGQALAVAFDNA